MFAAVGNHVDALHRSAVGGLTLGDLGSGDWRALNDTERMQVFAGGSAPEA
jgi:16S rRNA pseudouridine516 synthase